MLPGRIAGCRSVTILSCLPCTCSGSVTAGAQTIPSNAFAPRQGRWTRRRLGDLPPIPGRSPTQPRTPSEASHTNAQARMARPMLTATARAPRCAHSTGHLGRSRPVDSRGLALRDRPRSQEADRRRASSARSSKNSIKRIHCLMAASVDTCQPCDGCCMCGEPASTSRRAFARKLQGRETR